MKLGKNIQRRLLSFGEEEGRWGQCGSYIVWICNAAPSLLLLPASPCSQSQLQERNYAQPSLKANTDNIGYFENAEQGYKVDVVDMKFGSVMQRRLLSFGEEEGRWGRCGSYEVWISNAAPSLLFGRRDKRDEALNDHSTAILFSAILSSWYIHLPFDGLPS